MANKRAGLGRRLTKAEQATVRALHAAGRGRNEIARETGIPQTAITSFCQDEGLSFDMPPETAQAIRARADRCRALRAELAEGLLKDAVRLRGQLFAPAKVFSFGGKDNTYEERDVEEPVFADKRNIVQAVSVAVTASTRLTTYDGDGDEESMKSAITQLFGALKVAWDGSHPEDPADEE